MDTLVVLLQKPKNLKSVFILLKLAIKIALNFLLTILVKNTDND